MIAALRRHLDPAGRTDRSTYQIVTALWLALEAAIVTAVLIGGDFLRDLPDPVALLIALLLFAMFVVPLLLTIRRLRDAGWSTGWALFMFIQIQLGPALARAEIDFMDITVRSPGLDLIPMLIGVIAASRPRVEEEN